MKEDNKLDRSLSWPQTNVYDSYQLLVYVEMLPYLCEITKKDFDISLTDKQMKQVIE